MNTYYLIRHGQDEDNANGLMNGHRDTPLTNIGLKQAYELADKFKLLRISVDIILSSPLVRAFKTAQIVAEINHFSNPIVEPKLIERESGEMTGTPRSKILEMFGDRVLVTPTINYFLDTHGVETFPEMVTRANELFKEIESRYDNKNILLVGHGDMGKMIYCAYFKLHWEDILHAFHFGNSEMMKLSPDTPIEKSKIISIEQFNT